MKCIINPTFKKRDTVLCHHSHAVTQVYDFQKDLCSCTHPCSSQALYGSPTQKENHVQRKDQVKCVTKAPAWHALC